MDKVNIMESEKTFNISVIGDISVGKTSWITMLSLGVYPIRYIPTLENESRKYIFPTNCGDISIFITEHPGKNVVSFDKIPDGIVAMFDVNRPSSYIRVKKMIKEINQSFHGNTDEGIPTILCGNKSGEITLGESSFGYLNNHFPENDERRCVVGNNEEKYGENNFIKMSIKNCINYPVPLLKILKKMTGNDDLELCSPSNSSSNSDEENSLCGYEDKDRDNFGYLSMRDNLGCKLEYIHYSSDSDLEIYEEVPEIIL